MRTTGTSVAAAAQGIITATAKDFPAAALEPLGLEAVHPDGFLLDQLDLSPPPSSRSSATKPPAPGDHRSPRETWRPCLAGQAYPDSPTRSSASWAIPWMAPDRRAAVPTRPVPTHATLSARVHARSTEGAPEDHAHRVLPCRSQHQVSDFLAGCRRPGRFGKEGEERTVYEVVADGTDASEGGPDRPIACSMPMTLARPRTTWPSACAQRKYGCSSGWSTPESLDDRGMRA
jgi:hypothetical protein